MKSLMLITILIISIRFINAQIYTGLKSKIVFPTDNYVDVDNGIGVDLLLGYSIKQKLDFSSNR